MPYIKERLACPWYLSWCVHPPFGCCYSRSFIAIYHVHCPPVGCNYRFCQWVESMHFYKCVGVYSRYRTHNTGTSICHSTLDRWTIGNKCQGLNRCRTRLIFGTKSVIRNRHPGFYLDKYGTQAPRLLMFYQLKGCWCMMLILVAYLKLMLVHLTSWLWQIKFCDYNVCWLLHRMSVVYFWVILTVSSS